MTVRKFKSVEIGFAVFDVILYAILLAGAFAL